MFLFGVFVGVLVVFMCLSDMLLYSICIRGLDDSDIVRDVVVGDGVGSVAVAIHGTGVGVDVSGVGGNADVIHGTEVGVGVDGVGGIADVIHGTEFVVVVGVIMLVVVVDWLMSELWLLLLSEGPPLSVPRR